MSTDNSANWHGLFRIALGALASIAADEDTNAEVAVYAQNTVRALTGAAEELGGQDKQRDKT